MQKICKFTALTRDSPLTGSGACLPHGSFAIAGTVNQTGDTALPHHGSRLGKATIAGRDLAGLQGVGSAVNLDGCSPDILDRATACHRDQQNEGDTAIDPTKVHSAPHRSHSKKTAAQAFIYQPLRGQFAIARTVDAAYS